MADADDPDAPDDPALGEAVAEALKTVEAPSDGQGCPICMEDDGDDDAATTSAGAWKETPCGHRFHGQCVERWLQAKGSCPMCRHQVVTMPAAAASSTSSDVFAGEVADAAPVIRWVMVQVQVHVCEELPALKGEANTNDVTTHVSVAGPLTVAVAESLKTVDAPSDGHDCPICMEDDNSAAWKETPCEHRFHGRCVERWLQAKGSCPMCRRQLVTMPAAAAPSTAGFSDLELDAIVDLVNY
uniref:RING-type domain-containing protein n=1 Tax=Aegilops tauschii TaxID=37682 RepID=M8C2Z6_AEGTA